MAFTLTFDTCNHESESDTQLVDRDGTVLMQLDSSDIQFRGPANGWSLYGPTLSNVQHAELVRPDSHRPNERTADRHARLEMIRSSQLASGALTTSWCV